MKRFAEVNGTIVTAVVDTETSPGATFVEVPADQPCAEGYTVEGGVFKPATISFGYGVAGGFASPISEFSSPT
jgi:hypothetical protein